MNKVAYYLGSNPELFEHYLDAPDAVLGELLNRYAEPSLVREVGLFRQEASPARGGEGRQGAPSGLAFE